MNLRPYEPKDLKACVSLYAKVFNAEPWNDQWTADKAFDYLSDIVGFPGFMGWVAEEDGRIVGMLFGLKTRWWSSLQMHLREMAVDQEFQRKGVGTALVVKMKADLKKLGVTRIHLLTSRLTWPSNFWRKNGFVESSYIQFMMASL